MFITGFCDIHRINTMNFVNLKHQLRKGGHLECLLNIRKDIQEKTQKSYNTDNHLFMMPAVQQKCTVNRYTMRRTEVMR